MPRYSAVPKEPTKGTSQKRAVSESGIELSSSIKNDRSSATWPSKPRTLKDWAPALGARLTPHALLLLLPMASIGLGIAVLQYNGKAESSGGDLTRQTMAVTATLWPILFAAVLGPALKAAALYQAERGVKLGVLEVLFTSQTLVSTLRSCFTLRIASIWPLLLILIWSLSPIGGQSALRALDVRSNSTTSEYQLMSFPNNSLSAYVGMVKVIAMDSGKKSIFETPMHSSYRMLVGASFAAQDMTLLHANESSTEFTNALRNLGGIVESVKLMQRDLWRNVRIPFIHTLPAYTKEGNEWISVPLDKIPKYSSFIGVPLRGFPSREQANSTFTIQTSYQTLKCQPWTAFAPWVSEHNNSLVMHNHQKSQLNQPATRFGLDLVSDSETERSGHIPDVRIDPRSAAWSNFLEEPSRKMSLAFISNNVTLCEIATEYVDSAVECSRTTKNGDLACFVIKMRTTPGMKHRGNLTALDFGLNAEILANIPFAVPFQKPQTTVMEEWLLDPSTMFASGAWGKQYFEVPLEVFSDRLAAVLNTNLLAATNMSNFANTGPQAVDQEAYRKLHWANTTGTWTTFTAPVYQINKVWFSLYFVSAIIMLLCAVANVVLRSLFHAPDFFGSISALTRDSMFFDALTPASGMDGTERAKLLQNRMVMIQDVAPDDAVGRIAFSDNEGMVRLQKDRTYR